ncbi:hypothetical protein C2E20_6688 [Micractinium conductrix]|uniref:Uncharacterized protein n=1 Tax=Micractinium conductrix TaxID=554055 RepID=A0A2P6V6T9_9CHLO|nr:hypothetical protein C2E20_6688 [Micractinium conductrix]|eukprot:PSC69806.1 hypothetical protein C2E20_6688 [Micractinium conductrix]
MLLGGLELQAAMARAAAGQDDMSMPWADETQEWQMKEQQYREQLERHYHAQAEAEFNSSLASYYQERRQHQHQQQRLNQVLYGHAPSTFQQQHQHAGGAAFHAHLQQQHHHQHPGFQQRHMQFGHQHQQHVPQQGGDCWMADWRPAASPRQPLAAVNGMGGGMQWEAAAAMQGIKRGAEALSAGGDEACPDSALKRRFFRHP